MIAQEKAEIEQEREQWDERLQGKQEEIDSLTLKMEKMTQEYLFLIHFVQNHQKHTNYYFFKI